MHLLKCNLDIERESYGFENKGISRGMGISQAAGNSLNSGIPEAQTFPSPFPGNGDFLGISCPWFAIEHYWFRRFITVGLGWAHGVSPCSLVWGEQAHC